jgi:trigger factor
MKVTTERLDNCQVNVFIELDAKEIDGKLRQTARKISREFAMPGYRKGRAPYHAVVRIFGLEAVQQETLENFGNDLYDAALEEVDYEPFDVGSLEEVEWDPFRMTVLLPIQPEVELGEYAAVRVPFEPEEVTDEQIDEYLHNLQREHGQWVPVEREAAIGDQVVLDMHGRAGEEEVMNNEGQEMLLIAEATYPLPGFHEEIVGMSPGEEKTFTLTMPEDEEEEEFAGREAEITVRLHTVREEDLPPLDDDLAMMVGDYDTLDDLKADVWENLETDALQQAEAEYLEKVLDAMVETAERIEYPPKAVEQETEVVMDQMERNLAASGMQLDTFLNMIGKTRDMYKQELSSSAEDRLKKRLVLNKVAEEEGLTIEEEELEEEIERLIEAMGDQAASMRALLETPGGKESVNQDLLVSRAQQRVVEIAKGEVPAEEEEAAGAEEETTETEATVADETEEEAGPTEVLAEDEAEPEGTDQEPVPEEAPEAEAESTETAG